MKSPVIKRSIVIAGHKTSVSLEDAFWKGLKEIADDRSLTLSELVSTIDTDRRHGNLSSAIRLFVLDHYRTGGRRPRSPRFRATCVGLRRSAGVSSARRLGPAGAARRVAAPCPRPSARFWRSRSLTGVISTGGGSAGARAPVGLPGECSARRPGHRAQPAPAKRPGGRACARRIGLRGGIARRAFHRIDLLAIAVRRRAASASLSAG